MSRRALAVALSIESALLAVAVASYRLLRKVERMRHSRIEFETREAMHRLWRASLTDVAEVTVCAQVRLGGAAGDLRFAVSSSSPQFERLRPSLLNQKAVRPPLRRTAVTATC